MDDSTSRTASSVRAEHHDVIVVGAGISGIGAAYHLKSSAPTEPSPFSKDAETSAARGIFSVTQEFAPIATCTPWATRSSRGRPRSPSLMAHRSWPTYVRPWPNMTLSQPSASTTRWYALNGIRPQRPGLFTPSSMSQRSSSSPAISSSCVRVTTATGAVTTRTSRP